MLKINKKNKLNYFHLAADTFSDFIMNSVLVRGCPIKAITLSQLTKRFYMFTSLGEYHL